MTTHPLFKEFPLQAEVDLSIGRVPTPYHIYDGLGTLIVGTISAKQAQTLLVGQHLHLLQTNSGRAIMAIWVCDFTDASLGPHSELQMSIAVAHQQPTRALVDHPLALLAALLDEPAARLFCHGLWNNTPQVVAYNREHLGLNARLSQSNIQRTKQDNQYQRSFTFMDASGTLIFQGRVAEHPRTHWRLGLDLVRLIGLRKSIQSARAPYLVANVVNPITEPWPYNADAPAYIASDQQILQYFDQTSDQLSFDREPYRSLDFQGSFVEHFSPFRFVYLDPQ